MPPVSDQEIEAERKLAVEAAIREGSWQVDGHKRLTGMEILVARLHVNGCKREEIAKRLRINSIKTVDSHLLRIRDKLGVENAAQLAKLAITKGWVTWS